ncbi:MAG: ribosomal RNA small subunit methyltransferase G [Candidatus Binatia bacterium]|nr:MAG: ribosomal RNA small subunit methyltransferase G [Candidatus Binatia bacterium]
MKDDLDRAIAELVRWCDQLGIRLSQQAQAQLQTYVCLILEWNRRVALTGARTVREIALHHILDCLHVAPVLAGGQAVADVGSGAGFPGMPLAIARPDCVFTLIEPRRKRATFLRHCIRELGLANASVEEARVEDLAPTRSGAYNVVVSRAFAELSSFVRAGLPLLQAGGLLVAMKGPRPEAELQGLPAEVEVARIMRYRLPEQWGERTLVILSRR